MRKLLKNLYDMEYIKILTDNISIVYLKFDKITFNIFDKKWKAES